MGGKQALRRDVRGTASVEYAVILVLVAISCAGAMVTLSPLVIALFRVQMVVLSAPTVF